MPNGLINEGLMLMLVGMGTVFVFLTALVIATMLMSRLLGRFGKEAVAESIPDEDIAAISAAVARHRRR
jgi:oxaloacetate decarboxylase gamma subunit